MAENSKISAIKSLPRKWVIKDENGFFVEPYSNPDDYNLVMKYEADAFRFTEGEAIDFLTKFPKLKSRAEIIQVIR